MSGARLQRIRNMLNIAAQSDGAPVETAKAKTTKPKSAKKKAAVKKKGAPPKKRART